MFRLWWTGNPRSIDAIVKALEDMSDELQDVVEDVEDEVERINTDVARMHEQRLQAINKGTRADRISQKLKELLA